MSEAQTDQIQKRIHLGAPVARVWRALTDFREFGAWFGVEMEGAFVPGELARGRITHKGYEHVTMEIVVERIEPERLFSYRWHPHAVDPDADYSNEEFTLVVFTLEDDAGGTLLTVTESGFDRIPLARRATAFEMNSGGWAAQLESIARYVADAK